MKSEYFKSQQSQIRGSREKEPPKTVNWDRIVYLTLLTAVVLTLLYYLFDYSMVLKGEGRVYANHHAVRLPVDARVVEMFVEEGDSVTVKDSLFTFLELVQPESPQKQWEEQRRLDEKLVQLESMISSKRKQIEQQNSQLEYYQSQKGLVEKEIKLDLSSPRDLRDIEQKIVSLKAQNAIDTEELNSYYQQRAFIEDWKSDPRINPDLANFGSMIEFPGSTTAFSTVGSPTIFAAPATGVVERIEKTASELAIRSESILTIRKKAEDIFIQVIFPRSSLEELEKGDTMQVDFDNGVASTGIISSFYTPQITNWDAVGIAEYKLNDYVVCRLEPVDEAESKRWEKNNNIGVTVSKIIF